jgi:hypothetical protein
MDEVDHDGRKTAAATALELSAERVGELLEAADPAVVVAAVHTLYQPDAIDAVRGLLNHQSEAVRVAAVRQLDILMSPAQLDEVLVDYMSQGTYFYNVVSWLDRLLFAPEPLRQRFRDQLAAS